MLDIKYIYDGDLCDIIYADVEGPASHQPARDALDRIVVLDGLARFGGNFQTSAC